MAGVDLMPRHARGNTPPSRALFMVIRSCSFALAMEPVFHVKHFEGLGRLPERAPCGFLALLASARRNVDTSSLRAKFPGKGQCST